MTMPPKIWADIDGDWAERPWRSLGKPSVETGTPFVRADIVDGLAEALRVFAKAADARRRTDHLGAVCFKQPDLLAARAALAALEETT